MAWKQSHYRNKKLKKLEHATKSKYFSGAYFDERKNRIIRQSCNTKKEKYLCRKQTRCKIKDLDLPKSNIHKKYYDYKWRIF